MSVELAYYPAPPLEDLIIDKREVVTEEILMRTCDWGGCGHVASLWRWSSQMGWLPVCDCHKPC